MRRIAVIDTNILFSATGWKGTAYECVKLARTGEVEGVTCKELMDELAEKLQFKLACSAEQSIETVADFLAFLRVVPITGEFKAVSADPDDDKVLECAVLGGATHVVTGDRRHLLPMGGFQGIAIVTAAEFLKAVTSS